MSVAAVSGSSGGGSASSANTIQALQAQAKSIQQQLTAAEKDTTMDAKTKAALVTQLSAQLATIQSEIAQKQQQAARAAQSQSSQAAQSSHATHSPSPTKRADESDDGEPAKSIDGTGTRVNTYA